MRQYNDDDIEVLGGEPTPRKRRISIWWFISAGIIAVIAIIIVLYSIDRPTNDGLDAVFDCTVMTEVDPEAVDPAAVLPEEVVPQDTVPALPREFTDSINDVVFTVIPLVGCRAAVTFEKPDSTDCDILISLPAADIRADNGEIVGEFIHDRQQLSRGVRKQGFCYISPEGNVTIGSGEGEAQKKSAIDEGGTFFRQYSLVMEGEIQPNILKGKAERRALAILQGKPTIVISRDRESIYDFSQALADYGFSHAIYLPGGKGFLKLHTDKTDLYNASDHGDSKYFNYLIFKH